MANPQIHLNGTKHPQQFHPQQREPITPSEIASTFARNTLGNFQNCYSNAPIPNEYELDLCRSEARKKLSQLETEFSEITVCAYAQVIWRETYALYLQSILDAKFKQYFNQSIKEQSESESKLIK